MIHQDHALQDAHLHAAEPVVHQELQRDGHVQEPPQPVQAHAVEPGLRPIVQLNSYYNTPAGRETISSKVTALMRGDGFKHWMHAAYIHEWLHDRSHRRGLRVPCTMNELLGMFARYTARYPTETYMGVQYWRIVPGRHAPHEDMMYKKS